MITPKRIGFICATIFVLGLSSLLAQVQVTQTNKPNVTTAGPNVTFTANPTSGTPETVATPFDTPPKALGDADRKAAILKARELAGINKPTLNPNPPAEIVLTPLAPRHGQSWVDAICMRTYPAGASGSSVPFWSFYCSTSYLDVRMHTVPGKAYLVDVTGNCTSGSNRPWAFSWAVMGHIPLENNHLLGTFIAKYEYSRMTVDANNGACGVSEIQVTRLN